MTTNPRTHKRSTRPAAARPRVSRAPRPAASDKQEPEKDEPEEGAGNNDERELPEVLKQEQPASGEHRPPTNAVPDRAQDPARPGYKEPHPKDKIINTLGYDPDAYPYESPDFIDVSAYDLGTGRFQGASFL